NEVLVQQFLEKRISFLDIQNTINKVMQKHNPKYNLEFEEIFEIDCKIRGELKLW
ncbi:MAG TPA: 1-deoxy-D-xylulose-5-phosphate reductoisomerase, partial [Clostridiales bacterium]|nr:1-deoxy-D-xylulose-5-phosphate reductoisomerase [Clostridiales bacterium]